MKAIVWPENQLTTQTCTRSPGILKMSHRATIQWQNLQFHFLLPGKTISQCLNDSPSVASSATNPCKEELVYALLDRQRDAALIDQEVSRELQADAPVKLKVTATMGKNTVVNSERVSDLARGYSSATVVKVPHAYPRQPTCKLFKHSKLQSS